MDVEECREEQQLEVEAIESIYESLYQPGEHERAYALTVEPTADAEDNHAAVKLLVEYPELYPEAAPSIGLERVRGAITQGQVEAELRPLVDEAVAEAAGDVCIFLVAEAVKEWLAEHNEPELSMHEQMLKRSNATEEVERAEQEKREAEAEAEAEAAQEEKYVPLAEPGAIVTPESFAAWKLAFERQQEELAAANRTAKDVAAEAERVSRPTGRQLFERNQELGVEKGADGEAPADGKDVFFFSEAVYGDGAEEDLPDTDSDEDDGEAEAEDEE